MAIRKGLRAATGSLWACVLLFLAPGAAAEVYVGLVHPQHDLTLSMGVGGVVARINARLGEHVRANQTLLVLDDRVQSIEVARRKVVLDDTAEIRATEDRVKALETMYAQTRRVFEKTGSISRDEMTRLEVEYSAARARLEQLKAQEERERLEYELARQDLQMRQLVAPVDGVVTRIEPKVGEWAKPGDPLIQLVDASVCYLKANVPLEAASRLRVGMRIPIRFEEAAKAAPVQGRVTFVSAVADPASGLVEVRITFDNPGLRVRPGVKGMIDLPGTRSDL